MKQIIEIVDVLGREFLDSRGNPTVEVEVYLVTAPPWPRRRASGAFHRHL